MPPTHRQASLRRSSHPRWGGLYNYSEEVYQLRERQATDRIHRPSMRSYRHSPLERVGSWALLGQVRRLFQDGPTDGPQPTIPILWQGGDGGQPWNHRSVNHLGGVEHRGAPRGPGDHPQRTPLERQRQLSQKVSGERIRPNLHRQMRVRIEPLEHLAPLGAPSREQHRALRRSWGSLYEHHELPTASLRVAPQGLPYFPEPLRSGPVHFSVRLHRRRSRRLEARRHNDHHWKELFRETQDPETLWNGLNRDLARERRYRGYYFQPYPTARGLSSDRRDLRHWIREYYYPAVDRWRSHRERNTYLSDLRRFNLREDIDVALARAAQRFRCDPRSSLLGIYRRVLQREFHQRWYLLRGSRYFLRRSLREVFYDCQHPRLRQRRGRERARRRAAAEKDRRELGLERRQYFDGHPGFARTFYPFRVFRDEPPLGDARAGSPLATHSLPRRGFLSREDTDRVRLLESNPRLPWIFPNGRYGTQHRVYQRQLLTRRRRARSTRSSGTRRPAVHPAKAPRKAAARAPRKAAAKAPRKAAAKKTNPRG